MDLSSVRIREHFGLLSNDTSTGQFHFLISPPKNRPYVQKNDYVLIDHPLYGEVCQVISVITEITSHEEVAGSTISERVGRLQATATILGYVDLRNEDKSIQKMLLAPNPGCRVYVPIKGFLEDLFKRNIEGQKFSEPLQIGHIEGASTQDEENNKFIKYFIDLNELTSKNSLISSINESGKTYISKKIVKALQDQNKTHVVIFDFYGEYSEVKESVRLSGNAKIDKETLLTALGKSRALSFNGQGLTLQEKQAKYNEALKALLKIRLDGKSAPFLLVIEEAQALQGPILEEAVCEGRKMGLSVCLITTHPSELGGKILSQTSNYVIGKTTDPADTEYFKNALESADTLATLAPQEWIIGGVNALKSMKVLVE